MSLHSELLAQARHLLKKGPRRPKQVSLRRAVSGAYYAFFHLLIHEASRVFVKDAGTVGMLARSYNHGEMLEVSRKFARGELPRKLHPLLSTFGDPTRRAAFEKIKSVAQAFVDLQDARHEADYDLSRSFTRSEATKLVERAERAFSDWKVVRSDDLARIYLSCFLVSKAWDRER